MGGTTPARNSTRPLPWADSARAVCVCLVVLMHGEAQIAVAGWTDHARLMEIWETVNAFLRPIRMPTFFTISGIMAAGAVFRPKPDSVRKAFLRPMYLYILWAAIFAVLVPNYPAFDDQGVTLPDRIKEIVLLGSPAWYLYALGLYFLVARITRDLPTSTVLLACFLVSMLGAVLVANEDVYASKLGHCLFFFVAGVHMRGRILAFTEVASARRMALFLAIYVAGWIMANHVNMHLLPLDVMAVGFGITAFTLAHEKLGRLSEFARWVGRRTLLIYVLHFPLICLLSALVRRYARPGLLDSFAAGLAYPVVAMLLVVPASLGIGELLKRMGLNLLFDLPRRKPDRVVSGGSLPA